jgi:hypothetical protein
MHIKLHFMSDSYDVRKYGMKRMTMASFEKGTIRFKLYKLTKKYSDVQLREFFISNFVKGDKYGGMYSASADEVLLDWQKRIQGLTYHYTQDILHLQDMGAKTVSDLWNGDSHPMIAKEYLGKRISLETMVILDKLYTYRPVVDARLKDDFIWKPISRLMYKYEPFLTFSKEDFQVATEKVFGING